MLLAMSCSWINNSVALPWFIILVNLVGFVFKLQMSLETQFELEI